MLVFGALSSTTGLPSADSLLTAPPVPATPPKLSPAPE
tara:strand:- start:525 stop:638 length:114 start_codon:yes stop_codon:yes gene_type:complete